MHATPIKVRGYHLDLYGHVNNARYLEFLEEARWAMLEASGQLDWFSAQRYALVITRIDIRYLRPSTMGDELVVESGVANAAERHIVIRQRVMRGAKVVAEAEVHVAVIHPDQRGALKIEGEVAERLMLMKEVEQ
ncbi:acyl-CoA thioesterase [Chitinibacteraceae bacterium HSL-7]